MRKIFMLICAATLLIAGCADEEPRVEYQTEKVSAVEGALTLTHEGKISLSHELMIHSNISGSVLEKYFKDGDEVTERQKLFRIGNPETETELIQTKAALAELMTTLAKETAAKNPVEELQAEIAEKQERIKTLEETSDMVYAPITGQMGIDNLRLGEAVLANETVLGKVGKIDPAVVRFEVSSAEKNFLAASEPKISLKFNDGTAYARAGTINFINDTTAEATFDNPEELLLLGNTVQIELESVKISNALLVPENAIQQRDGENFVLVVDENKKAVSKKISLGGKTGNQFIVTDGLKAGDSIVVEGAPPKNN